MTVIFYHSILSNVFGLSAEQRSRCDGPSVHLSLEVKRRPIILGTPTVSEAQVRTDSSLCRTLHGHDLQSSEYSDQTFPGPTVTDRTFAAVPNSYSFSTSEEVSVMFADMLTSAFYHSETCAMRLIDRSESLPCLGFSRLRYGDG